MLDFCLQKIGKSLPILRGWIFGTALLLDSSMCLHDLRFPRLAGAIPRVERRQGEVHPGNVLNRTKNLGVLGLSLETENIHENKSSTM